MGALVRLCRLTCYASGEHCRMKLHGYVYSRSLALLCSAADSLSRRKDTLEGRVRRLRVVRSRGLDARPGRCPGRTVRANFKLSGDASRRGGRHWAEAIHNEGCYPTLNQERRSRQTCTARPAATTKATPLAQSGIAMPPIVMSQPIKSRSNCSKETTEKTTTATRVKGLDIFCSLCEDEDVTSRWRCWEASNVRRKGRLAACRKTSP